jgi:hypothetical protein
MEGGVVAGKSFVFLCGSAQDAAEHKGVRMGS